MIEDTDNGFDGFEEIERVMHFKYGTNYINMDG